jgi:hypothetical protein
MKRFREGFKFPCDPNIGMMSSWDNENGLVIIPIDNRSGQLMFRFFVE